ncbi:MAG: pentapeptide repeat-containing protein [Candidatus Muiribacteriota bacterium]
MSALPEIFENQSEIENENLNNIDLSLKKIYSKSFCQCKFVNCDFTETRILNSRFNECFFENCNFSNTVFDQTRLEYVKFNECKIVGVNFGLCDHKLIFEIDFDKCVILFSDFSNLNLKRRKFTESIIKACSFSFSNLEEAQFNKSDLTETIFSASNLRFADFRESFNYNINLNDVKIKETKFSLPEALNLLKPFNIVIE